MRSGKAFALRCQMAALQRPEGVRVYAETSHMFIKTWADVAVELLRKEARRYFNLPNLRYRWHRYRMRGRLRAVRREEEDRRRKGPPRFH